MTPVDRPGGGRVESEVGVVGVCGVRKSEECRGLEGRVGKLNSKSCDPFLVPVVTPVDRPRGGRVESEVGQDGKYWQCDD